MVAATCLPSCIATGMSIGSGTPPRSTAPARSPMTNTTGWPASCRVGSTLTRACRPSGAPIAAPNSEARTPAVHTMVPAAISSPPASRIESSVTESTFAPSISSTCFFSSERQAARRSLEKKHVELMLGAKVDSVTDDSIRLAGGEEIAAGTIVWTAGVRASDVGTAIGAQLGRQARVKVDATLQLTGHPVVFVIGDLAGATDGGAQLPMLIPVAMQEGRHVGATIAELVRN